MKHLKLISALLLVSLLGSFVPVHAQTATRVTNCDPATPTNALCIEHGAVTTRTDGLPTVFPVTYRLEQKIGAGAFTAVETTGALKHYVKNLAPADYTFRVFAIEQSVESAPSNSLGKTVVQAPPGAPVIVIAATIRANAPPTYRIVFTLTPKAGEVVFLAPESMRKLFAAK